MKMESQIIDIGWIESRCHFIGLSVLRKTRLAINRFLRFMYLLWYAALWTYPWTPKKNHPKHKLLVERSVRTLAGALVIHALNKCTRTQPYLPPRRQWRKGCPSCKQNLRDGAHV